MALNGQIQQSTLLFSGTDVLGTPTNQNLFTGFLGLVFMAISLWSSFSKSLSDVRIVNTQQALFSI